MRVTSTMLKTSLCLLLLFGGGSAHAAKITAFWTNPTQNTDGSPLTNLVAVIVEWGSCVGTQFGTRQAAMTVQTTVPGAHLSTFIYPTGLKKVCVRAIAKNANGVTSDTSNVAPKDLLPATGKPVALGSPVILNFNQPEN